MNIILIQDICVMATTRPMSNSSTSNKSQVLWQPLDIKSNDHTMSKSLKADI